MFTGLVETIGTIAMTHEEASGRRLGVSAMIDQRPIDQAVDRGASIAVNGCCLTVVERAAGHVIFQAGPETLAKTNLGQLAVGAAVNLERSLAADGRLGGHIVQGHVDGIGYLKSRSSGPGPTSDPSVPPVSTEPSDPWEYVWFEIGPLTRYLIPKGSVAVDGVSLTVVEVTSTAFSVALIPHTLAATTLGSMVVGAPVNIETDMIGKYILKYLDEWLGKLDPASLQASRRPG